MCIFVHLHLCTCIIAFLPFSLLNPLGTGTTFEIFVERNTAVIVVYRNVDTNKLG